MTLPKVCRNNRVRTHKMERVMVWMYSFYTLTLHSYCLLAKLHSFLLAERNRERTYWSTHFFKIWFDFLKFCISWPQEPSFSQQERVLRKVINTTAICQYFLPLARCCPACNSRAFKMHFMLATEKWKKTHKLLLKIVLRLKSLKP